MWRAFVISFFFLAASQALAGDWLENLRKYDLRDYALGWFFVRDGALGVRRITDGGW